jgi:hypothetical protein
VGEVVAASSLRSPLSLPALSLVVVLEYRSVRVKAKDACRVSPERPSRSTRQLALSLTDFGPRRGPPTSPRALLDSDATVAALWMGAEGRKAAVAGVQTGESETRKGDEEVKL